MSSTTLLWCDLDDALLHGSWTTMLTCFCVTPNTSPPQLVYCICSAAIDFHWAAAEHMSCHYTVSLALSHTRHQLCLLQPLCSDKRASTVLLFNGSHLNTPFSSHALELVSKNVFGLLHGVCLLGLVSDLTY